ncbi:hypothetical protein HA402_015163 [Bradysia odoriphaga]|nr:hypothetical protein HA402_015163 [Bradysia odoriphaga]
MGEEVKARAVELFRTFGERVISGEATGDDVGELRAGLREIAEELGLDLSGYEERVKPVLDELQENFDVNEFKAQLKPFALAVIEYYELDAEELKSVCEDD